MTVVVTSAVSNLGSIGYHNLLRDSTVTVTTSSEASGFEKENAYDWLTFDHWKGSALDASIVIDAGLGNTVDYNYIGIAAHDIGSIGGTITLQKSTDGISYTTIQTISPTTDNVVFNTFATETSRFIRILNSVALAKFGVISIGLRVDLPRGMTSGYEPMSLKQSYNLTTNTSINYQFIGSSREKIPITGNIRLSSLSQSWCRNTFPGIRDHLESGFPMFFKGEDAHDENQLVWLNQSIRGPRYDGQLLMSVDIPVKGQT